MAKNKIRVQLDAGRYADLRVAANQKVIEIHKEKLKSVMNIKFNRIAQKTLSLQGYALYMHFMCNLHGYKEMLSVECVTKTTALGEKAYYKAIKELIEKEYLVKVQNIDIDNYYIFYEDPSLNTKKKEFFQDESKDEIY